MNKLCTRTNWQIMKLTKIVIKKKREGGEKEGCAHNERASNQKTER